MVFTILKKTTRYFVNCVINVVLIQSFTLALLMNYKKFSNLLDFKMFLWRNYVSVEMGIEPFSFLAETDIVLAAGIMFGLKYNGTYKYIITMWSRKINFNLSIYHVCFALAHIFYRLKLNILGGSKKRY